MMAQESTTARLDPPQPKTVGEYVKAHYSRWVKRHIAIANFGVPVILGARMFKDGFSWEWLAIGVAAWVMACALIQVVVGLALTGAGWWKLHTKLSPYVPATILLVVAVLGYIAVTTFY